MSEVTLYLLACLTGYEFRAAVWFEFLLGEQYEFDAWSLTKKEETVRCEIGDDGRYQSGE